MVVSESVVPEGPREPLRSRVTLVLEPGGMSIDGVWWPRSDSLVQELPALDVALARTLGAGIARFSYVLGAWSDRPRRVRSEGHLIKLGWFSHGAAPDNVDLSLDDYRRVVLKVIPPDTAPGEAEAFIDGATVLTSWSDPRPVPATAGADRSRLEDAERAWAAGPEPEETEGQAPETPGVTALLESLAMIEDPRAREVAARRFEWRATEWALAAGRIRWGAHAEALDSAGEPPSSASPPWK